MVPRYPLTFLCLVTACSSANEQLVAVKQLRSAAAEWALVNREGARQHLLSPYLEGMRKAARDQIRQASATLRDQHSAAAREAAALRALPADVQPALWDQRAAALEAIEKQLESA